MNDFKGLWIPKEILELSILSSIEKMFLAIIIVLDDGNGCFASNKYFSDMFGLSKNRCSEIIKNLELKRFIVTSYSYKNDAKNIDKRTLKIDTRNVDLRYSESRQGVFGKSTGGIRKADEGYSENTEDIIYILNNSNYSSIVEFLNKKTDSKFKLTESVKKNINARLREGFTQDDFIRVIENMTIAWTGTEYEKYLRPSTLFGTKFQNYLNWKISRKENSNDEKNRYQSKYVDSF